MIVGTIAIFTVIGIIVGLTTNWFPVRASVEAESVDSLFNFMLAIAVVIFLIVEGGIIYVIWRYRARPGDTSDGRYYHGNMALEITWTAIPAVIVVVIAAFSFVVFQDLRTPGENALQIGTVGQQFQWSFRYDLPASIDPNLTEEQKAKLKTYMVTSQLYVPVNRPVQVNIESLDVMHAFYIPEFRIKQDAIPGRMETVYFTPTIKGEYWVFCAELCGTGHAAMSQINKVFVVEQAEYDQYVEDLYKKGLEIISDPRNPEVGKQLMASGRYPCKACHILTDAYPEQNRIGPELNGIATRAEGHAANDEGTIGGDDAAAYIRTSILNPNAYLVAGYQPGIMPQNYSDRSIMPEDDLEAIVNYLLTQK